MLKTIATLFIITLTLFSCDSTVYNRWLLVWELLDASDSSAVAISLNYILTTSPSPEGYEKIEGVTNDKGYINEWILFPGERDEFLSSNPSLNAKVYFVDNIVFDSLYYWKQLELDGDTNYQTLYISVNDTSQ